VIGEAKMQDEIAEGREPRAESKRLLDFRLWILKAKGKEHRVISRKWSNLYFRI